MVVQGVAGVRGAHRAGSRAAPGSPRRCTLRERRPVCGLGVLYPLPFEGEEAVGQERHGGVVVEAGPAPALEMIEAQLDLELLVAALDLPAFLPEADRLLQGGARWQVREGVLDT